jgi:hypothetical protein
LIIVGQFTVYILILNANIYLYTQYLYIYTLLAITPPFLNFLLGPMIINRRSDSNRGGVLVEKCKFLQESGCKGLCLHQCKIPAQEFFQDELGVSLNVSPNFLTQECQWSWGETAIPIEKDSSFPKGCLEGCISQTKLNNISCG